ncbi:MAG: (2Fe-2S)-binding protein [Pyrinomonadaceae bacterium]|nr:(2Fe-2S)-binding protein [Pyrinomonadaceae bacterium]
MGSQSKTNFQQFLDQHDAAEWSRALERLLPSVHEVDRNATAIWFAFFPLNLRHALAQTEDAEQLARKLLLQGKYSLREQIDSSHTFLYGHRFWPQVKRAVSVRASRTGSAEGISLIDEIQKIAEGLAAEVKAEESLLVGITAVALMTLQQVGLAAFDAAPGRIQIDARHAKQTPTQILRERAHDDSQGLFGFLRTTDKTWTVTWNENDTTARFKMFHQQEIASAATTDKRDWSQVDERCTVNEGPIPVQCRSASCGTCWVGVLSGAEKLSPIEARERKVLRDCGYIDTDEPRPLIRLSCQAQGTGAVSIRIPSWNGVFGKHLNEVQRPTSKVQSQQD